MESNTDTNKKSEAPILLSHGDTLNGSNNPAPDSYRIIGSKNSLYGMDEAFQRNHMVHSSRISREVYLQETNSAQRAALLMALNSVLNKFLTDQRSVFLDGFGIVTPLIQDRQASYNVGAYCAIRSEQTLSVNFEKCDDSNTIDRNRYPSLVETGELAAACLLQIPPELCISWLERDVRRYLRGLLKDFKHQVIENGYSNDLNSLGMFYTLHNRQGDTPSDWFAGADIGLHPAIAQRISVSAPAFFDRPVLQNSFELLSAAFGAPLLEFSVDLRAELAQLGYDPTELANGISLGNARIPVAVFEATSTRSENERVLIYCTDGLRTLALSQTDREDACGSEIVFQLAIPNRSQQMGEQDLKIPTWVSRPIAMAWILLQSSPRKSLRPGAGLSCEVPLQPRFDTDLDTIFLTPFRFVPSEVLSMEGPFRYINVVGITSEEAAVARGISQEHLLLLLKHKGLDQVTRSTRTSITNRLELPQLRSPELAQQSRGHA